MVCYCPADVLECAGFDGAIGGGASPARAASRFAHYPMLQASPTRRVNGVDSEVVLDYAGFLREAARPHPSPQPSPRLGGERGTVRGEWLGAKVRKPHGMSDMLAGSIAGECNSIFVPTSWIQFAPAISAAAGKRTEFSRCTWVCMSFSRSSSPAKRAR